MSNIIKRCWVTKDNDKNKVLIILIAMLIVICSFRVNFNKYQSLQVTVNINVIVKLIEYNWIQFDY